METHLPLLPPQAAATAQAAALNLPKTYVSKARQHEIGASKVSHRPRGQPKGHVNDTSKYKFKNDKNLNWRCELSPQQTIIMDFYSTRVPFVDLLCIMVLVLG